MFLDSAWGAEQGTWPGEGGRSKEEVGWRGLCRYLCLNPWGPLGCCCPTLKGQE